MNAPIELPVNIKERPILFSGSMVRSILDKRKTQTRRIAKVTDKGCNAGMITPLAGFSPRSIVNHISYCPHGKIRDHLWVRETFHYDDDLDEFFYKADSDVNVKWKPSIHMPRAASRILLEITDIRVEHLNDISELPAMAEGITPYELLCAQGYSPKAYRKLWESINGAGSWELNPWVWVIQFKVISK